MNRQELVDFVRSSFRENFKNQFPDAAGDGTEGWDLMINVLADCLEEAARRDVAPSCSVSYTVGNVQTTYTATSVPMLLEARRALMEADRVGTT
jgi:hypothetical protein